MNLQNPENKKRQRKETDNMNKWNKKTKKKNGNQFDTAKPRNTDKKTGLLPIMLLPDKLFFSILFSSWQFHLSIFIAQDLN